MVEFVFSFTSACTFGFLYNFFTQWSHTLNPLLINDDAKKLSSFRTKKRQKASVLASATAKDNVEEIEVEKSIKVNREKMTTKRETVK